MTPTATIPFQPLPELPLPALGEREWLLECHCARPVTDLLHGQGWDVVTDLDCNVHCSRPARRVYVGFLLESREADARRAVAHPCHGEGRHYGLAPDLRAGQPGTGRRRIPRLADRLPHPLLHLRLTPTRQLPQALPHRPGSRLMPRHSITVTAYHSDDSVCPSEHQHTRSGKPLTEGCTGQNHFISTCSCTTWTSNRSSTKNYATEEGQAPSRLTAASTVRRAVVGPHCVA